MALFYLGVGLGVCSMADLYGFYGLEFFLYLAGWPFVLAVSMFRGWGFLIAAVLGIVFWGMLYDIWNKATLFALSVVMGALAQASLASYWDDLGFGWNTTILLLPAILLFYGCAPSVQRWQWKRKTTKVCHKGKIP